MATKGRVLVALSGGVDSSVCVSLLKEEGYDVSAVVMRMSPLHGDTVLAAQSAAADLGIPLTVLDLQKEFEENVISYFLSEYRQGRTPNPCILCNPTVKFRALLEEADRLNCDFVATGHYAQIEKRESAYWIKRAFSIKRDQSYMLYRLTQKELSRLLFPLGGLEKPEVRRLADERGLSSAQKPDSQENCFISDKNYAAYIEQRLGKAPKGEFIAPDGKVCGQHQGIYHYTVGQRRGLGIALGRKVFVRKIDAATNRIYLADIGEDSREKAIITHLTFPSLESISQEFDAEVKIRSVAEPVPAHISLLDSSDPLKAAVHFSVPQRAVAPGQSIVFYQGKYLLGGGFIENAEG